MARAVISYRRVAEKEKKKKELLFRGAVRACAVFPISSRLSLRNAEEQKIMLAAIPQNVNRLISQAKLIEGGGGSRSLHIERSKRFALSGANQINTSGDAPCAIRSFAPTSRYLAIFASRATGYAFSGNDRSYARAQ